MFEQPGERPSFRQFTRGEPMTISTMISAEKLNERAITFGLAPPAARWSAVGRCRSASRWRRGCGASRSASSRRCRAGTSRFA